MRTRGRYVGRATEAVADGGLPRLGDMTTAGVKGAGKDKPRDMSSPAASEMLDRRGEYRAGASS